MSEQRHRLVTHRDCLDGSCCAIAFLLLHPTGEVVYVNPHEVDAYPGRGDGATTIFADVCPSSFLVGETVVDHHIGNIEKIRGKEPEGAVLDVGACGCKLLVKHLLDSLNEWGGGDGKRLRQIGNLAMLADVVDDYDRWVNRRPTAKRLAALHQLMGQTEFVREFSSRLDSPFWKHDEEILNNTDRTLLYYFNRMTERFVERCVQSAWTCTTSFGRFVCVFGDSRHSNDACHAMLEHFPEADFAVSLDLLRSSGSIRSRSEEYDCSAIARRLGGNGHRCAAGFPIDRAIMDEVRVVFGLD